MIQNLYRFDGWLCTSSSNGFEGSTDAVALPRAASRAAMAAAALARSSILEELGGGGGGTVGGANGLYASGGGEGCLGKGVMLDTSFDTAVACKSVSWPASDIVPDENGAPVLIARRR